MNHLELQALRQIFFMSIDEASTYIAGDENSERWRQWEKGEQDIPLSVIKILTLMNTKRKERINAIIEKINNRIGNNTMRFFPDYDAFRAVYIEGDYLEWKIYQSVAAELYSHNLERLC
ncbi:hypothetical protein BIY26_20505 [Brenneria goodwinii]|uniref:Cytoplasmic protein n=1 Tax=Brenneria goodwinii TaxID=1109412 RepID=A0A0G4JWD9_9GAMM|nr:YdiL family protein [Brenneria goodwinii]ATA22783.1 hypothetical protein AWC36_00910 [Brenneria goodwinii]MCG8158566.1 YdiL family protein [Brenneria goodwinii]MCG8163005.1 YdiL family protein [Brenneria goodwinii]MCG8167844.1 YdiL family protein [Brenneria goodwinii]MCG8172428.1 YdiL family protein [Brenneria goodwinii]